jgi:hypothetical protein
MSRAKLSNCAAAMIVLGACSTQPGLREDQATAATTPTGSRHASAEQQAASAEQLASQAQRLDESVQAARHAQLSGLLSAMADAIASLPSRSAEAHSLRERVDEFNEAEPESVEEMRLLIVAARTTLDALRSDTSAGQGRAEVPPLTEAEAALSRVSPQVNVLAQAAAVRELMHALTDVLLLALGSEPAFATEAPVASAPPQPGPPKQTFAEASDAAQQLVLLMSHSGWSETITLAGQALNLFADGLATLEQGAEMGAHVREIRFQAMRLLRSDGMDFTRGEWGKRGLSATVFGLEQGLPPSEAGRFAPWLETARASIRLLDDRRALAFQRARTQDAFRCVADLYRLAAQSRAAAMPKRSGITQRYPVEVAVRSS